MVAKKGNELHEPGKRLADKGRYFIKYDKIEFIVLQVEYAVGDKNKTDQGANKKR